MTQACDDVDDEMNFNGYEDMSFDEGDTNETEIENEDINYHSILDQVQTDNFFKVIDLAIDS